jgi:hypothetical protein
MRSIEFRSLAKMLDSPARAIRFIAVLVVLAPLVCGQNSSHSAESSSAAAGEYETGRVLAVQEHEEGRAFDWVRGGLALIPLYDHYPFYDITIQLSDKTYVVRYETQTGYYPAAWKPDSAIQVRRAHGRLYLLRYDGDEVAVSVVRKSSHHH